MMLVLRAQKQIFSAYRLDQYADPDAFMVQLGLILEQYADEVVEHVSSPLTGIQRRSEFPPTMKRIVDACDEYAERVARRNRPQREAIPREPAKLLRDRPQGSLANCFVPDTSERYAVLVEWAKTAELYLWRYGQSSDSRNGIWVNLGIWETLK